MVEYSLYGLRVRSDLELDAEPASGAGREVRLELAAETIPGNRPRGRVLAEPEDPGRGYWIVETGDCYALGIPGTLEARIALDFASIALSPAPATALDLLCTLAQGAVLATSLTLSGACILHASAVEFAGRAVAFVGASGSGKSTLAALCCAAGARLVTDDLLVVRESQGLSICERGTTRLRLREASADVARLLPGPARRTADDRWSAPARPSAGPVPLAAILLPERSASEAPSLSAVPQARAAVRLLSCPRIPGWRDERVLAATLRHAARVVRSVPVFSVSVPERRSPEMVRDLALATLELNSGNEVKRA